MFGKKRKVTIKTQPSINRIPKETNSYAEWKRRVDDAKARDHQARVDQQTAENLQMQANEEYIARARSLSSNKAVYDNLKEKEVYNAVERSIIQSNEVAKEAQKTFDEIKNDGGGLMEAMKRQAADTMRNHLMDKVRATKKEIPDLPDFEEDVKEEEAEATEILDQVFGKPQATTGRSRRGRPLTDADFNWTISNPDDKAPIDLNQKEYQKKYGISTVAMVDGEPTDIFDFIDSGENAYTGYISPADIRVLLRVYDIPKKDFDEHLQKHKPVRKNGELMFHRRHIIKIIETMVSL